jgi:hypothetical protein
MAQRACIEEGAPRAFATVEDPIRIIFFLVVLLSVLAGLPCGNLAIFILLERREDPCSAASRPLSTSSRTRKAM